MNQAMHSLALIGPIGHWELLIIGGIMLLLFGRRLPEVGRSIGQGIVQFKKGLRDIEDEVERGGSAKSPYDKTPYDRQAPAIPPADERRVSQADAREATPVEPRPQA